MAATRRGLYITAVVALFHALIGLALLDLLAWGWLRLFPEDPITLTYGRRPFALVYPGKSAEDVRVLLRETWNRPIVWEPFTDSRERRFAGRFVNVDQHGFRVSRGQGPWPPDAGRANVFVFGGSTTFGYGVADDETIVSALQAAMDTRFGPGRVSCYNFGRGSYYSTGERILFQELLTSGRVPRVAVFVDGLNEFAFGTPFLADVLRNAVNRPVAGALSVLVNEQPLTRLIARARAGGGAPRAGAELASGFDDPELLDARIERYLANRRVIEATAAAWRVRPLFVWQPVPTYHYDLRYHLFGDLDFNRNGYAGFGYTRMADRLRGEPPAADFLWLADMQEGLRMPLYVDQVHYTAVMSARVGDAIAGALVDRGLLP